MTTPIISDLSILLDKLKRSTLTRDESVRLVHICRSITQGLLMSYHKQSAGMMSSHGWSVYDLSLDCIAELFTTDAAGKLHKVEDFLEQMDVSSSNRSDVEVFLAFKGYINKFVLFRLGKLLSEADPEGRRIARNIREYIHKKGNRLRITEDVKGERIELLEQRPEELLPEISAELLEREVFPSINQARSIPEILEELADALQQQDRYRRSVRLIDTVQVIKRFYAERFFAERGEGEKHDRTDPFGDLNGNAEVLRDSTLRLVAEKIDSTYYRKRKLELNEARALLLTLSSILDEWFEGVDCDGYFRHAEKELHCTKEEYESRWAPRVHYLVKLMRAHLKDQLDVTRGT